MKTWLESKINWVAVMGVIAQVANFVGWMVPPDLIADMAVMLAAVQSVATIVMRTWFTTLPIVQSVKK